MWPCFKAAFTLIYIYIYLSIYLSIYIYLYLYIYIYIYIYIWLYNCFNLATKSSKSICFQYGFIFKLVYENFCKYWEDRKGSLKWFIQNFPSIFVLDNEIIKFESASWMKILQRFFAHFSLNPAVPDKIFLTNARVHAKQWPLGGV